MDSVTDPFGTPTEVVSFLEVVSSKANHVGQTLHTINLDNMILIEQRVRYNFWQLLGDVGGFYDGIGLIISSAIGPITLTQFIVDLFAQARVDQPTSPKAKRSRKSLAMAL